MTADTPSPNASLPVVAVRDEATNTYDAPQRGLLNRGAIGRRFMRNTPGVVGLVVVLLIALASYVGGFFVAGPNLVNLTGSFAGIGAHHLLGTDDFGRDMLSRLLAGGRVSLEVSILATVIGLGISMLLGVSVGYLGGIFDDVVSRLFDVIATFPILLMAVLIQLAVGKSIIGVTIAIAVAVIPRYGRQWRIQTKSCKERDFVTAVRTLGYSDFRIVVRHILPNTFVPVVLLAAGNLGKLAIAEASLSFIGAGVQPPNASWGNMISEGLPYIQFHPAIAVYPGIALSLLSISFSFIGDALRDAFDISE